MRYMRTMDKMLPVMLPIEYGEAHRVVLGKGQQGGFRSGPVTSRKSIIQVRKHASNCDTIYPIQWRTLLQSRVQKPQAGCPEGIRRNILFAHVRTRHA